MRQELLEILEAVREEEREILEEGCDRAQDDGRRPEADPDQDSYEIHCIPAPPPRFY